MFENYVNLEKGYTRRQAYVSLNLVLQEMFIKLQKMYIWLLYKGGNLYGCISYYLVQFMGSLVQIIKINKQLVLEEANS